jgi:hypothetical protein
MALPTLIELQSGADRRLKVGLWLVWMAALGSVAVHLSQKPVWLVSLSAGLLLWSIPLHRSPIHRSRHLLLHANGQASIAGKPGHWQRNIWRSRWYTVIRIEQGGQHWHAWISAQNNSAHDYRRLGVWSRFCPRETETASG